MNDGSDDDSGSANGKGGLSSDDDDAILDNTGVKEASFNQANLESSDAFDSLKEDTPAKKAPIKRKLGAKAEVVEPSGKRSKRQISSDDDSPVKVKYRS